MTTNAETALNYALSLAHATAGGGVRRTPEQIIEEAAKYREFLDASDRDDLLGSSVWVLTSPTYTDSPLVGVFATREAAEQYRDYATPPVTDGDITEWMVTDLVDHSIGETPETGEGQ